MLKATVNVEAMFYYLDLVDQIDLPPRFFGPQLNTMIFERLKDKVMHHSGKGCGAQQHHLTVTPRLVVRLESHASMGRPARVLRATPK